MNPFIDRIHPGVAGLAVYEPGRPIEEVAREQGLDVAEVVKLASNENALGPSPMAVRAMRQAAPQMHLYPDGGAYYLKRALAETLGVAPEQILPANGSNEVINLLAQVFLGPGRGVMAADRAFVVYRLVAAAFQAPFISVPMKDMTHDLDAMLAAITPETSLVFISNPNNPTSTMVGAAAIERFMERVPEHVVVCFDEAYVELLPPELQPDTLRYVREGRPVVVLRTFSKTYGLAGLRLGYAVAPSEGIDMLNRVRQPFNVNAMAMQAALAALQDKRHLERTQRMVARGIRFFERALQRMGLAFIPPCANFVLIRVGQGRRVFEALQARGVIVRPMDAYMLPDHIRVTIGLPQENKRFISALEQVLQERGGL